jgi:hypothetical protein
LPSPWPGRAERRSILGATSPGPGPEGTDVTESFELPDTLLTRLYRMFAGRARLRTNRSGMRATVEKIRAIAESADSSG